MSPESNLSDFVPEIPSDIVKALNEPPKSTLADSTPEIPNDIPPESDLANSASKIPDDIIEALNESAESHLAESPPASPPSLVNSSIKAVLSRQSNTRLSPAFLPPITIYESLEPNLNISQVSLLI
ncbi:hypothetical protein BYT27DRAFT_7264036 [Phlegmacium glaucopus]|nr:hypothetical protein BYT27DRAFT_7264036 [Phlegmacium glaucopus]